MQLVHIGIGNTHNLKECVQDFALIPSLHSVFKVLQVNLWSVGPEVGLQLPLINLYLLIGQVEETIVLCGGHSAWDGGTVIHCNAPYLADYH